MSNKPPLVVDTNIVFKALRLKQSAIRDALIDNQYQLYAPKFLIVEIFKHKEKLLWNNAQLEGELYEYLNGLMQRITFVSEEAISIGSYLEAYRLCKGKASMKKTYPSLLWQSSSVVYYGPVTNPFGKG